jgi:hypothetical protein
LKLALFHEVTVENFVVGPPDGFTKDVLRIDFAHVSWVVPSPRKIELVLPDITVRGINVAYEQNEHGTNIDAFQKKSPTPSAPAEPPPEKKPLEQPSLPIRVALEHLDVSQVRAEVLTRPSRSISGWASATVKVKAARPRCS